MVKDRLKKLREKMAKRGLSAYIIPTADPHNSEYIADYYKTREFISGFTGSQGTAVVTMDEAKLWADGRYFIQAEFELANSEFELMKMGNAGVPTIPEYLKSKVSVGKTIGFDGENMSYEMYRDIIENVGDRILLSDMDYIGDIWEGRPALPKSKAFVHGLEYSGVSPKERIESLREKMAERDIYYYVITALDEVCYLYSIRGSDVEYNPVVFAYGLVTPDDAFVYINPDQVDDRVSQHFKDNGITQRKYETIYVDLGEVEPKRDLYFDKASTNLKLSQTIPSFVRTVHPRSIVGDMKAVKNPTEISHQKECWVKEGVALAKFFRWLETGVPTGNVTEMLASSKLSDIRALADTYVSDSFSTISAYGPNAAMPHYSPSKAKPVTVQPKGLYLVDTGGQYLDGTTDITRTFAMGEVTEEEKFHYTMVLKSHIALASAVFKKGTTGHYLDAFAKAPLWKEGLDFNHGTGHGIGYFMNVHEGPQRIASWPNDVEMQVGMCVSIEPGVYIEGSHGVRLENIVVVKEYEENEFGTFYAFDTLTAFPFDTRPVDVNLLNDDELDWLNAYNSAAFKTLAPHLEGEDLEYLENRCKEIAR